ncbi:hypothetical protein BDZ88DRAFT_450485 [Geranomyces variabilis]|nr:hypothetical protein BDZ88DRAFT_450485 [Geranomyces variabilis]KAJ3131814.1 hypothetical protein HDU90_007722 [Geranomyces variabilis]
MGADAPIALGCLVLFLIGTLVLVCRGVRIPKDYGVDPEQGEASASASSATPQVPRPEPDDDEWETPPVPLEELPPYTKEDDSGVVTDNATAVDNADDNGGDDEPRPAGFVEHAPSAASGPEPPSR